MQDTGAFMVEGQESREKFKRADQLFRDGDFAQALALLEELDRDHPDTRNILVPMAMCLDRLGRPEEALPLAERLTRKFADSRARALAERLRLPRALPEVHVDALISDHDFAAAYDLPDLGPITTIPVPEQSEAEESRWPMAVLCGGCTLLIFGLLLLPMFSGQGEGGAASAGAGTLTPEQTGVMIGIVLLAFAYSIVAGTITGILGLGALSKLPANTIGGIVLDVGGTILVVNLISAVLTLLVVRAESPALGIAVAIIQIAILLYAFYRNYNLGIGGVIAFAVIYFVLSCVLVALPVLAIVGAGGILAFFLG
jgi:hypothetical protein